ncbi:NACHT domain-containing protein [Aeromonas media]
MIFIEGIKMSSAALALSGIALKEIVSQLTKKLLEKQWSHDTNDGKEIISQLSEGNVLENYTDKYVSKNLKIRTLHSAEADIYLDEIYSPLTLSANSDITICVDNNFSLEYRKIVNIIGIAGQGKSTILRKIFLEEMKRGLIFPFFIELRKLNGESILEYFKSTLKDIGLNTDNQKVEFLLQSKKALLLLDGFDEIPSKDREKNLREIIKLNTQYNARIIVTSRPGTEICHEPDIANLTVRYLKKNDIINIINKLDKRNSSYELCALLDNNAGLIDTLKTPILVNLLYVCYPYLDIVPENTVDFYDKLFITLYSRHDKIKNFNREKYSGISAGKANEIFNALCFESIRKGHLEFNEHLLNSDIKSALTLCDLSADALENIKQDFINVTCLIQKDGFDRFVYLHRTVQEFHAAKFISSLPLDSKKKIYKKLKENISHSDSFYGVIIYLMDIDKNDCESQLILAYANDLNINNVNIQHHHECHTLNKITHDIVDNIDMLFTIRKKKIQFSGFESISSNRVIRNLNLFYNRTLELTNDLDNATLEFGMYIMKNLINNSKTPDDISKKAAEVISNGLSSKVGPLVELTNFDFKYNEVSDFILEFYKEKYIPISERANRMSHAIEVNWD